ncbi:MAG: glycosyltransferase family 4 protein [Vicinamibacterales bacterium]
MTDRVLHVVIPGDLDTKTGGYGYDRQIIQGLRTRGWTVRLTSLPGDYPMPAAADRATALAALAAIPDGALVLVDGLALGALPVETARERARLHLVALVHHPLGLETGFDAATSRLLLESERRALESVRGVVVTSRRTTAAVESLGVPLGCVAVVEPGTDAAPEARGSDTGARHLLCVASLTPRKGHDTLFDALDGMLDLDWHLTCVGSAARDSAHASRLAVRASTPPLGERVTLAGELSGASLAAAYDAADLFVLPTHYEGYGMVVAEALARALPVVSTATGAVPELVGADAGLLVPPGDAVALRTVLRTVMTDPAEFARLRAGARAARSTLPSWDGACARMEAALMRTFTA